MIPTIGEPHDRVDGRQKVTGEARYAAENNLPNLAYAVLVTSSIPAGSIAALDAAAAKSAPGVLNVISHLNAPKLPDTGGQQQDSNAAEHHHMPFSDDSVHYVGQAVAAVVADTFEHATYAAGLVRVTYRPTPARIVMEEHRSDAKERQGNAPSTFSKGDAEGALAGAPVKVDQIYRIPYEHHNQMEPHALVAAWDGDRLTVHDSAQNIFTTRQTLAKAFGIPAESVRVMSPFVGGAFGSKGSAWPHVFIAVMAARMVRRPVKIALTRRQAYFSNGHRPLTEQRVALGATADGKLVAMIHEGIGQTNTVCDYVEGFTSPTRSMYATPNVRVAHRVVELDLPSPTYMRAPGENPGMYALESAMDEMAYALTIDPIQLRLLNHADADPASGKPWSSKSIKECYTQGAERFGWPRRTAEPRSMRDGRQLIGLGMASATYPSHRAPASARAVMHGDGNVDVSSGTHEMGMGTATVMAQLAAETLSVPFERVRFRYGDTTLPRAPISAGSLTVASVGSAVFAAASQLKRKVIDLATADASSPLNGADPNDIDASDGRLALKSDPSRGEAYSAILRRHYLDTMEAAVDEKPQPNDPYSARAFGAVFAEVGVDPDLGIVRVRRIVAAFAGGRILNAKTARSQYYGGIIQGIGMALLEQTHLDRHLGAFTNVNLAENLVPINADVRSIDVILVPEDDPHVNPIGAKGIGEVGIVGVAPAIANAVYHATGKRVRDLPITIEKLL
ncbi:MAG TPA: xanthine dehydrogenase family protein molybdopterin-binding subunit [Thermoanaerobaculia bacterium]